MTEENEQIKLVLLGTTAVGKSSLVLRFTMNDFKEHHQSTMGAAYLTKYKELSNGRKITYSIWDTAGQERYKSLVPMYYRDANAAIVVYDVCDKESFDKAKAWVDELTKLCNNKEVVIAMAGNKVDLIPTMGRAVDASDAEKYCKERGIIYAETSAKTGFGVNELFDTIGCKLPEKEEVTPEGDFHFLSDIHATQVPNERKRNCCSN